MAERKTQNGAIVIQGRNSGRYTGRVIAGMLASTLVLAACGGGEASDGAADDAAGTGEPTTDQAAAETGSALAGDGDIPDIDLSGQSIRFTTSKPGALNMGTFWLFEKLEDWGADVEEIIVTTTSGVQAMIAGESDAGAQGADEVILGASAGADVVAIGSPRSKQNYVLVANSTIDSIEDLQGKTIAMSGPSGFDALLSRLALEEVGMDPDSDAKFVQIGGSPDRAAALASGNADAATIFLEDWYEIEQRAEDLQLVTFMAELFPQFPADAFFTNRSYLDANPEMATAIACANLEANSWINSDKESFVSFSIEKQDAASEEGVSKTYDAAQEVNMFPTEPGELLSVDGMTALMEAMLETGDIDSPVDVSEVVDTTHLEEAAKMGCGA